MSVEIADPRSARASRAAATTSATRGSSCGSPASSWSFLVLGHLLIMNILDGGVQRINFGFVAGRWSSPFWQVWDLLQLWLAMLHGGNGMRTIISDYAEKPRTRFWLLTLLAVAIVFILVLGTLVIFTFDPTIA